MGAGKRSCGVFLALVLGLATVQYAQASGKPPALADIIFDKPGFLARLPKKTLTDPDFLRFMKSVGNPKAAFNTALSQLGDTKGIEFVPLPDGFTRPWVISSRAPVFPSRAAGAQQAGHADFLVLIGASGGISAIYCTQSTDDPFAIAGANAAVLWRFAPAHYQGQALPVLVMLRIRFTMILNGRIYDE